MHTKELGGSSSDGVLHQGSERKSFVVNKFLVTEIWENIRLGSSSLLKKHNDMQVPTFSSGDS